MAEIEPLYDKKCSCILCGKQYTSKKIRSRFVKTTSIDTDFAPVYADPENNPALYYVYVCPHCGFSSTEEFSPFFPPGTKEELQDKVCSHWRPHDYSSKRNIMTAIQTLKLGAFCASLKKEKHIVTGGLYIRTAWLHRSLGDKTQEHRFLSLACGEYANSYSKGDFKGSQVSETRILYLLGELSHRLGKHQDAVRYFSKVIENQKQSLEPTIVRMAKNRWHEIREDEKAALPRQD
ncbi:DUF2225 domain-containing protein [Mesobacillus zeae]|uniref:DUF2225 domain-containing protein n=1 Tax=Mesobacillus zeae TaxID=1917180 RepID=A0A398BF49_9BACI|nr:DUF2225 domain-containing protein [Mesobacillus zeae]RID88875.1 DUF2225 domain-containing protein [Mesobacillus zeae]